MQFSKPKILGILLFAVVNGAVITIPSLIASRMDLTLPVDRDVQTRKSLPIQKSPSLFGEILAREYTQQEKEQIQSIALSKSAHSNVLGAENTLLTPTLPPNLDLIGLVSTRSGEITIAVLGDSMVDTLQKDLPQLRVLLSQAYPNITFTLYNYGVGATNIEQGLTRLTNGYDYLDAHHPPLLSTNPHIIVVESFAYNPWSNSNADLNRQWVALNTILDTISTRLPESKVVLAATIDPNSKIFGDGVLNWSTADKKNKAVTIRSYLQNIINYAGSTKLPLADAYHASIDPDNEPEGDTKYINGGDHLHPSGEGGYLFCRKIVEAIIKNNLIPK